MSLGTITVWPNGDHGALLGGASDSLPITEVDVSSTVDFAMARFRYSNVVLPAFFDPHVHLGLSGDTFSDDAMATDFEFDTRECLVGGVTTIATTTLIGREPLNLFWFAHHAVLAAALTRLPAVPCLSYGDQDGLERQLCEFLLRGLGLHDAAIAAHLRRDLSEIPAPPVTVESA